MTIRVRMALRNTGEIESSGSDVIGLAINRAARVTAAAHGGQIVLSDTTQRSSPRTRHRASRCATSGSTGSRDLRAAEACQTSSSTACLGDSPLRTVDARPNNLPTSHDLRRA